MVVVRNIRAGGNALPSATGQLFWRGARLLTTGLMIAATLIAVVVFASTALPAMLGHKAMVVTSGSMVPTIGVGDIVVIRPVAPGTAQVGDVITFVAIGSQHTTTHRVIATKTIQGETYYQTQGDANATPDPNLAPAGAVSGRVVLTLPKAGYLLHLAGSLWGKVLLIGLPLVLVIAKEVRGLRRAPPSPRRAAPIQEGTRGAPTLE